jgi:hydrogenase maturation protease
MITSALVICIGNELAADDGAGLAVYRTLEKTTLPAGTRLLLLGVGGMELLDELDGEDCLVVVDAVQFGARPGTIHNLDWNRIPSLGQRPVSGHGIGIREAIEVGRRLFPDKMPTHIRLIGIEGNSFTALGAGLSAEVADAVDLAAAEVVKCLAHQD